MLRILTIGMSLVVAGASAAETTCYGEYPYQVCTTVNQRADGSMSIVSSDSQGNDYRVDTTVEDYRGGGSVIRSYDSQGNSYEVKSWTDSRGVHSRDSDGNTCSILFDGTSVGC
jgi:hypothetical protein